jgi:hypothetical protein
MPAQSSVGILALPTFLAAKAEGGEDVIPIPEGGRDC